MEVPPQVYVLRVDFAGPATSVRSGSHGVPCPIAAVPVGPLRSGASGHPEIYSLHRGRLEGMGLADPSQMDGTHRREPGSLRDRLEKGRDPEDALRLPW